MIEILGEMGIDQVTTHDIEGCHRLPMRKGCTNKPTIVKFVNRKLPESIMGRRRTLKDKNFNDIGLSSNSKIFVNINLSPAFKSLDYFFRKLKRDGMISSYITSHSMVKIKHDNRYHKIFHVNDLVELFPNVSF